jgi:hypothetical protein
MRAQTIGLAMVSQLIRGDGLSYKKTLSRGRARSRGWGIAFDNARPSAPLTLWGALETVRERDSALSREVDQDAEGVPFSCVQPGRPDYPADDVNFGLMYRSGDARGNDRIVIRARSGNRRKQALLGKVKTVRPGRSHESRPPEILRR